MYDYHEAIADYEWELHCEEIFYKSLNDFLADLYDELDGDAIYIVDFVRQQLQSFYVQNPLIAQVPLRALNQARELFTHNYYSAALVFAFTALEVSIKKVLTEPIVYGLIPSVATAKLITKLIVGRSSINRFKGLLFQILREQASIDFETLSRPGEAKTLWKEIDVLRELRNAVVHRADTVSKEEAERAISAATFVLEEVFSAVIQKIGLRLCDGYEIRKE